MGINKARIFDFAGADIIIYNCFRYHFHDESHVGPVRSIENVCVCLG